jgi:hypothetical protein
VSDPVTVGRRDEADSPAEPGRSDLERAAGRVFAWVLKLYPRRFRELFAEEMLEVFTLAVCDASRDGIIPVATYLVRELAELPMSLLLEHLYQRRRRSMGLLQYNSLGEIRMARWVARVTSLLIGGFVVLLFLFNEDIRQDPTPPTLILGVLSLSVLAAWRWERVAGTLTLLTAPIFFVAAIVEMVGMDGLITPYWALILIDAAITCAYLILGWLYVSVAKHAAVATELGAERPVPETSGKRLWAYLGVGLLGLSAIAFFVIPMFVPVQQQMEVTGVESDAIGNEYLTRRLMAAGAVVGVGSGHVEQPFFSVPGYELVVDGEIVQAFEYVDISSATTEAAALDAAESSIPDGTNRDGTPRFYQDRNVLLLYAGDDQEVVTKIEAAFGPPFAGG